jgi:hypothetical protein
MAKTTKKTNLEQLIDSVTSAIELAKLDYQEKPTNPMYSVITDLELTLMEIKKQNQ